MRSVASPRILAPAPAAHALDNSAHRARGCRTSPRPWARGPLEGQVNRGGSATLLAVLGALVAAPGAIRGDVVGRRRRAATARRHRSRACRTPSTRPHPGDIVAICPGTYAEGSGRARHERADDREEPHAEGRRRRPRADHAAAARRRQDRRSGGPRRPRRRRRSRLRRRHAGAPGHGRHLGRHDRRRGHLLRGRRRLPRRAGQPHPQPRHRRRHLRGRHARSSGGWRGPQPGYGVALLTARHGAPGRHASRGRSR